MHERAHERAHEHAHEHVTLIAPRDAGRRAQVDVVWLREQKAESRKSGAAAWSERVKESTSGGM